MPRLLQNDLFQKVLIDPVLQGCDGLHVLTGYSSASFVAEHLSALPKHMRSNVSVNIFIGMAGVDGISEPAHRAFKQLVTDNSNVSVHYASRTYSSHSKVYVWTQGGVPTVAWVGSPNYSRTAFAEQA